ncbi:MAG: ATP-binding protein [Clostridiales bacterium]|nr:ATP-binding protein [Clostridiales bacterium]
MYRKAMENLQSWRLKSGRKPLIIRGARQVGKTWLMKKFGASEYENTVYLNFENNRLLEDLFTGDYDIERLITGLELFAGKPIDSENTLLIFDEIQEIPKALTALKYFYEDAPQYHIVCAGSLLGVALHEGTSFPVGKVEFMDLYPLSFSEFVMAMGKSQLAGLIEKNDFQMITTFKHEYINLLKQYYFVGGMPEAVFDFSQNTDFDRVRLIQQRILDAYEQDFSKHAPSNIVPRIRMLWNSIPAQLARENKKFLYGLVKEGARAKEYETAMLWLLDCGLAYKVHRIKKPNLPIKVYEDEKAFKFFVLDIGLLSCMVRLQATTLLDGNEMFKEFKGALTEQYVLQELKTLNNMQINYWTNENGSSEIDFVLDNGRQIIPLEVKAELNLQAKSLKVYRDKYSPKLSVRVSMADYEEQEGLISLPLYLVETIKSMG